MNYVFMRGILVAKPEMRSTANGKGYCNFRTAVRRDFKAKGVDTDFFNCIAWGQSAEYLCNYGEKGARVTIAGNLQNDTYEKDGKRQYSTQVVVRRIELDKNQPTDAPLKSSSEDFTEVAIDEELPFL